MKVGIIGGTIFFRAKFLTDAKKKKVKTPYGTAELYVSKDAYFIQRHGNKQIPPHSINYKANIYALKKQGITKVIAGNSVGSFKTQIKPGSIVIPHDYLQLSGIPTFHDKNILHTNPDLNNTLRQEIISAAKYVGIKTINKGVILNTKGPRFETKAEVQLFKQFADIVGMTMAYEAILCQELNIEYSCICSVDNYANGINETTLNLEDMKKLSASNAKRITIIIRRVLEVLKCPY